MLVLVVDYFFKPLGHSIFQRNSARHHLFVVLELSCPESALYIEAGHWTGSLPLAMRSMTSWKS